MRIERHHIRRAGHIIVGHSAKQVEEFLFDFMLYPAMIALLGTIIGGLIMTALSAIECYFLIRFYDLFAERRRRIRRILVQGMENFLGKRADIQSLVDYHHDNCCRNRPIHSWLVRLDCGINLVWTQVQSAPLLGFFGY